MNTTYINTLVRLLANIEAYSCKSKMHWFNSGAE